MLNVSVSFLNMRGQFASAVRAAYVLPVFVALGASGNFCWALATLMKRTMAVNEITLTVWSCSRWGLYICDIGSQRTFKSCFDARALHVGNTEIFLICELFVNCAD